MMQPIERAIVLPVEEIAVHRAARWQVLRQRCPLAAGAQDIHDAIDDLAHIDGPLVAATLGRRDERVNQRPFGVRQVARIAQLAAVVAAAVLGRPHAWLLRIGAHRNGITSDSYESRCSGMDTK